MQIKQIDVLVHPDYFQMDLPYLPLHKRQLELREKWEERIDVLKDRQDAILLYFSNMATSKLEQGLKDISVISNKIEREEIERIQRCEAKLGNRLVLFSWMAIPSHDELIKIFESRGISYNPSEIRLRAYGEIFEMCMTAWGYHITILLGISSSNIDFSREESLTDADCKEIYKWRVTENATGIMVGKQSIMEA